MSDAIFWWVGAVICLGLGPIVFFMVAVWSIWESVEAIVFRLGLLREFKIFMAERYRRKHKREAA